MRFMYYCLIVLGRIDGVKEEIHTISESPVNLLEAKGLIISTFYTAMSVSEITSFFNENDRNFIIFEMAEGMYGANITDKKIFETLFGGVKEFNNNISKEMSGQLMSAILNSMVPELEMSGGTKTKIVDESTIKNDICRLSYEEKNKKINELIDKGLENLTEYDKKYFNVLTKEL